MSDFTNNYANELHRKVIKNFPKRKVIVYGLDDIWGADLVDMQEWEKENNGYKYMLNVIDVFSKYAWSKPLKNKNSDNVLNAFKNIINESKRKPERIWVDQGGEFYNSKITKFTKENNIILYSSYGDHKSAVVESFNKTLKNMMWKYFTSENTRKWIDILDELLNYYNNERKHSTIKTTPKEASKKENELKIYVKIYSDDNDNDDKKNKSQLKVGDWVRISRIKGKFEKGYLPNWSREIFKISKVQKTSPITYKIVEYDGTPIEGSFYEQELLKTEYMNIFEVEKILKKRKNKGKTQYYVKWLGWDEKYDEWIDENQLDKIK